MAVALEELIESLRREVSQPGAETTTFPDATDDTFLGYLSDAFWEIRLDSLLTGFEESDGEVTPTDLDDVHSLSRPSMHRVCLLFISWRDNCIVIFTSTNCPYNNPVARRDKRSVVPSRLVKFFDKSINVIAKPLIVGIKCGIEEI